MNQGGSSMRNPHLTSLSHLEGLLYTSLRLTKNGHEAVRTMQEAISHLPIEYRLVFILSYLEGYPREEIAAMAGVEPKAVELMLQKGRELIQKEYFRPAPGIVSRSAGSSGGSEGGGDLSNSRTEKTHECGRAVCCKKHHPFPRE
jgi:hypothetical protein